ELRLADLLGRAGKYDEAIQTYKDILQKDPSRTIAHVQLAKLYLRNEEPEKAIDEIEKAGPEHFEDEFFLMQIADVYSKLGDKEKTLQTLEKIVRLDPYNLAYRRKLADAYDWNGESEKARVLYEALLSQSPNDPELLNKVVYLNLKRKRFQESLPFLTKLVELQPGNIRSRILLADVYIEIGKKQMATEEFERVLKIQPGNEPVRLRLAELYIWAGDYDRGLNHYEVLVARHPGSDQYFDRFTGLAYNLDPARSIQYYRLRLENNPGNAKLRERFAALFLHLGDTDNAVQQISVLIAHHRREPRYYKQLGYLYQDLREPYQATKIFETMLERNLADEEVFEELVAAYRARKDYNKLLNLYPSLLANARVAENFASDYAALLYRTRHYPEAAEQYSALVKLAPDNPAYRLQLVDLLRMQQKNEQAAQVIWDGVEKYQMRDEAYLSYAGQFLGRQGLLPQSIFCYAQLMERFPDDPSYKELLVAQYVKKRDFAAAIEVYNQLLAQKPHDTAARFELASLYWREGDFARMQQTLDEIRVDLRDGYDLNLQIGRFFFQRGFYNKSIEFLDEALKASPNDSLSLRMLGLALAWNNQPKRAMHLLQRYNRIYPHDYFARFETGALLASVGRLQQANHQFQISLDLISAAEATKDSRVTQAKIYAYRKNRNRAIAEFESIVADYPNDVELYIDYAESLLNLKEYELSDHWLAHAFKKDPDNYRALRLQSRSYFEQGRYADAVALLRGLLKKYPDDTGLRVDLSDSELAAGDWYASTETLREVLKQYPKNIPAQERLTALRRERSIAVSTDFESAHQSGNFVKQLYDIVVTKAKTSLLHLKLLFGQERYTTRDNSAPEQKYQNLSADLSSSFSKNLKTSVGAKVQQNGDNWYLAMRGKATWDFDPANSLALSATFNEIWNDPFSAAFQQGRLDRVESDLNLSLFRNLFFWNRLSYEKNTYLAGKFGNALRSYFQIGRRWKSAPGLMAFYQFYYLKYNFDRAADTDLISFPEKDAIHYVGGDLEHQIGGKLNYHLSGSIGFSSVQNTVNLYGVLRLEYTIIHRLRLRSLLEYGNQNKLSGDAKTTSLWFDLSYFY
ncbi:MAG: tetratricopeptide repeat protein, partial [bacterium]